MGAIQKPTAAMGSYGVELRRESFYLTAAGPAAELVAQRVDSHVLRVPVDHAPPILAALDQVTSAHRGWKDWTGTPRADAITVVRTGDWLDLHLPLPVYAQEFDDADCQDASVSTEIEYADVDHLRSLLAEHT
jgi:hypothetical protein